MREKAALVAFFGQKTDQGILRSIYDGLISTSSSLRLVLLHKAAFVKFQPKISGLLSDQILAGFRYLPVQVLVSK
jgi:hypothetical protein